MFTEKDILRRLKSQIRELDLNAKSRLNVIEEAASGQFRVDVLLTEGTHNLAIVEIVTRVERDDMNFKYSFELFYAYKTRFIALFDGFIFYVFDRFREDLISFELEPSEFLTRIRNRYPYDKKLEVKQRVYQLFEEAYSMMDKNSEAVNEFLKNAGERFLDELQFSDDYELYFRTHESDFASFEFIFFGLLIDQNIPDHIYRYTSFNTGFLTLYKREIQIHGLLGMNDSSEPDYVDTYLNPSTQDYWKYHPRQRAEVNRRFLLSCTTLKEETLLPWRLYGEDGKGICFVFKVKEKSKWGTNFFLGKVNYADERGEHRDLEHLKKIIEAIRREFKVELTFRFLHVWRHFFKPKQYQYEQEIRLLYVLYDQSQKEWLVAEPYCIVNPFIRFDYVRGSFPLEPVEVILGPKKSEMSLNVAQLRQLLAERKSKCRVSESTLKNYR